MRWIDRRMLVRRALVKPFLEEAATRVVDSVALWEVRLGTGESRGFNLVARIVDDRVCADVAARLRWRREGKP